MSAEHWFGTDSFGRDVFSRVLLGTQARCAIGVTAPVLAARVGTWAGMLAGYFGGWTDRLLSRFADLLMSFPSLLLGVMIAAALGPGFRTAVVAIAIALFPRFVRLARSATQVVRREPFIDASIASGRGPLAIMARHVLPNIAGPLVVALSLWIATAIRLEAALSFLGLGAQPPAPSWGNMIRDGHERPGGRSLAGGVRRRGHHPRRAGLQHGRRRAARPARPGAGDVSEPLLEVDDLRVHLFTDRGVVRAVDGVGFRAGRGRVAGHRRRIRLRQDA